MNPVLGREVVERQQLLDVVADLGDRLRKLRTIGRLELFCGISSVVSRVIIRCETELLAPLEHPDSCTPFSPESDLSGRPNILTPWVIGLTEARVHTRFRHTDETA
jgi:hypothetical protein